MEKAERSHRLGGRSSAPLLMALAPADWQTTAPSGRASRTILASPAPSPPEGTTLLHSVILQALRPGPAFCLATLHLEGREAAEMCTTDGRNYLAHLTSEIPFFPPFLLSLPPLSTNYSKAGEIDRFLVLVGFGVVHRRPLFCLCFFR